MRPGITKSANVGNTWGRLATLYDAGETDKMVEDGQNADGLMLTITTNTVQIVFADATPTAAGHPMADGDYLMMDSPEYIRRAWVKNNVSGSVGVAVMTPLFNT